MSPLGYSWGRKGKRSTRKPRSYGMRWGSKATRSVRQVAAKVNKIARAVSGSRNRVYYNQAEVLSLATATGTQPSTVIPLTNFSYWTRTFGTDTDDENSKKAIIRKSSLQYVISANGELDQCGVSLFLVKLRPAARTLLDTNGNLQATLTQGTHFTGTASKVLLNPNFFDILKVKRYILGDISATRGGGTSANPNIPNMPMKENYTGRFNISYNMGKGLVISNPAGDWKSSNPTTVSNNYYVLCFCDDSTLDTKSLEIQYNANHVVDAA